MESSCVFACKRELIQVAGQNPICRRKQDIEFGSLVLYPDLVCGKRRLQF